LQSSGARAGQRSKQSCAAAHTNARCGSRRAIEGSARWRLRLLAEQERDPVHGLLLLVVLSSSQISIVSRFRNSIAERLSSLSDVPALKVCHVLIRRAAARGAGRLA